MRREPAADAGGADPQIERASSCITERGARNIGRLRDDEAQNDLGDRCGLEVCGGDGSISDAGPVYRPWGVRHIRPHPLF